MILSAKQIIQRGLLTDTIDGNYYGASYNLRIAKIISMNNKEHEEFDLPPQGMVLLVSKEVFHLPKNVVAYTTVKNSMSIKGLLAINVGIVDPHYEGQISSLILNFGKEKQTLKKDDTFLRMTFHQIMDEDDASKKSPISEREIQKYVKDRSNEARANLHRTFLYLGGIREDIVKRVFRRFVTYLTLIVAIIAVIGFVLSYSQDFVNFRKNNRNKQQQIKIESLETEIEQLKTEIEEISKTVESSGEKKKTDNL